tara:strand:+ start:1609 stop:1869 length:261 start_codon:yes stop_codon:yes gene_type:complete
MISNLQYRPKNYCKAYSYSNESQCHLPVAATGDHTAKPLEEAKRNILSCFLAKGMEGDADSNKYIEISAGELHEYVQANLIQQSSG